MTALVMTSVRVHHSAFPNHRSRPACPPVWRQPYALCASRDGQWFPVNLARSRFQCTVSISARSTFESRYAIRKGVLRERPQKDLTYYHRTSDGFLGLDYRQLVQFAHGDPSAACALAIRRQAGPKAGSSLIRLAAESALIQDRYRPQPESNQSATRTHPTAAESTPLLFFWHEWTLRCATPTRHHQGVSLRNSERWWRNETTKMIQCATKRFG